MNNSLFRFFLPTIIFFALISSISCQNSENQNKIAVSPQLTLIGEQLIKANSVFDSTQVGGLSGIDYANNTWYAISDDSRDPIRFYELELNYTNTAFTSVEVIKMNELLDSTGNAFQARTIDGESIRFDRDINRFVWTSEGALSVGIAPTLFETHPETLISNPIQKITNYQQSIPNGSLEGLSLDYQAKGYWFAMELPLVTDGEIPTFTTNNSPIRINYFDKNTQSISKQYAYQLDKVGLEPKTPDALAINGLVELLAINEHQLLAMERSYTSGYGTNGNVVKIYLLTMDGATDVSSIKSLKTTPFVPVKKELLLNLNTIKNQLPSKRIDNLEGMCLGPKLSNGNNSLLLVADNNFNKFGEQLNQFIVFEFIQ
ncbi:esterase-like activity of phytase family protein [Aquimarina agarivorans]|uniref:esterase-like activity of phytase family protein n=1 Tax=Aquimarina agarivorans TaxID=980584 RepID=UPI000248E9E8|nr:esterase-like activity of phytase family protein [Aquimarina agarivorans]